ncbi:cupin domain-containing protein [Gammaproteobacteria bacterium AH-315-M22]|nr:cupin domain-containing protein [Gammaproteobacteria bacterium AH-315-M22]
MKINADLTKRAVVNSRLVDWVASLLPGVDRKMLERDGDEVARVTSIVRYASGSSFSPHVHTGGEEFIVLEGIFSDETGDFETGTYVRNPVGSSHKPSSEFGCQIFVKLWQMPPDDQAYVRINIHQKEDWQTGEQEGELVFPLHHTGYEKVGVTQWSAGFEASELRSYRGGVEFFVLSGSFSDASGRYKKGVWLRLPIGASHTPKSDEGCMVYIKTDHLMHDLAKPPK